MPSPVNKYREAAKSTDSVASTASANGMSDGRKQKFGQTPQSKAKYRDAVEACDSEEFIDLTVSEIARTFSLAPASLLNQLRTHFPDIVPRREEKRRRLGIADNLQRGVSRSVTENYSGAVELLRQQDVTIQEAAGLCGVTYDGLRQYLVYNHRDLLHLRSLRREVGQLIPRTGRLAGNGTIRKPDPDVTARYAEAVELYGSTSLSIKDIAIRTGVRYEALRQHLRQWHRDLMFRRRNGVPSGKSDREPLSEVPAYSRETAEKYAPAIMRLRSGGTTVEAVARESGLTPEVFRGYLRVHEPELWKRMGMATLPDGRKTLRRSAEKYAAAIEAYRASDGRSLRSIAADFGLSYKSLSSYIRRNCH